MYLGSDAVALAPLTDKIVYLEEGDWVLLNNKEAKIYDVKNCQTERRSANFRIF